MGHASLGKSRHTFEIEWSSEVASTSEGSEGVSSYNDKVLAFIIWLFSNFNSDHVVFLCRQFRTTKNYNVCLIYIISHTVRFRLCFAGQGDVRAVCLCTDKQQFVCVVVAWEQRQLHYCQPASRDALLGPSTNLLTILDCDQNKSHPRSITAAIRLLPTT